VRPSSWLVVGAVAIVALLAVLDALRGAAGSTAGPSPTETNAGIHRFEQNGPPAIRGRGALEARLLRAGIGGTLFLTDETCRLRVLLLPALEWLSQTSTPHGTCDFAVAPDARRVQFGSGVAWSPDGRLAARCASDGIHVFSRTGTVAERLRGLCAPAWKPDGTFTAARGAVLVERRLFCRGGGLACESMVLGGDDLAPALRGGSTPFRTLYSPVIKEAIWLDDARVALVVRARVREEEGVELDLLALYEGRRLVAEPQVNRGFDDPAVSPSGRYLAIYGSTFRGLFFLDRNGRLLARNPLASGHHAAWSPDERWTLVATGGSAYFFRTRDLARFASSRRPETIRIPVYAADLDWR
jgi:hypothetical protein